MVTANLRGMAALLSEEPRPIKQYVHSSWNEASGLSGSVFSLAQTVDGFLWVGTTSGLYRFDGITFEQIPAANGEPILETRSLLPTEDGGLWIAHRTGVAFLKQGKFRSFTENDGLPYGRARGLARTKDGTVWATFVGGFFRFANEKWEKVRADWRFPEKTASSLMVSPDGTLWVAGESDIYYLRSGEHEFHRSGLTGSTTTYFHSDTDGSSIWISEPENKTLTHAALMSPDGPVKILSMIRTRVFDFLIDSAQELWLAEPPGIVRGNEESLLQAAAKEPFKTGDEFQKVDGLTSITVRRFLEDREGNIWVGTDEGLERFRKRSVRQFDLGFSAQELIFGPRGEVWTTPNNTDYLNPIHHSVPLLIKKHTESFIIQCEYMDEEGTLWLGMQSDPSLQSRALWRVKRGKAEIIPPPPDLPAPFIKGIVSDGHGKLWLTVSGAGEYTWKDGVWERVAVFTGKDADLSPDAEFVDDKGRGWLIYYARNTVVMVDGDKHRSFTPSSGINVGHPIVGWSSGSRVWVAGTDGVAAFDGQQFQTVKTANSISLANVTAIIPTPDAGLWLKGPNRVIHIPADEIESFYRDFSHKVESRSLDAVTDFIDPLSHLIPSPYGSDANRSSDGLLWFLTHSGVAMVDPSHLAVNRLKPPVVIRSLSVDGKTYAAYRQVLLPKNTATLGVDYTALSLSLPERNEFKYQLVGFDKDWQNAGTRRQAFYTNLPPGHYTFRVIAANSDGVWNSDGASVEIILPPTFFQTVWFRLLEALAALGCLFAIFWWRVQIIELRARSRLAERLSERNRIARELHDTLLQGFQGLTLKIQAAALTIPQEEKAFTVIQDALTRADEVLAEGRDRVRDLRVQEIDTSSFEDQLTALFDSFGSNTARFEIQTEGSSRALNSLVHDEACRVAREALTNALLHSQGTLITVRIVFSRYSFRIQIHDNGIGIPAHILASGKDGHFGLRGMKERAQRIKAKLQIDTDSDRGTTVRLMVPARVAYVEKEGSWLVRLLKRRTLD